MAINRGILYCLLVLGVLLIGTGVGLLFLLPASVTTTTIVQTVTVPSFTPIIGASPVNTPDETREQNLMLLEATMYAKRFGITVDEALNRLKLQEAFSRLNLGVQLESNEAETFGGLWIQHEPEYKLIVAFTMDGEATLHKYKTSIPEEIAPYIEIRAVKTSHAALLRDQEKVTAALRNLGIPCDSATNIKDNNVRISITKAKQLDFEKAIQSGQLEIPETVKINFVDSLAQ